MIKILSDILSESFRNNDIVYSIDGVGGVPQWGVILFADYDGAMVAIDRIKQRVTTLLREDKELGKYDIQISIGVVEYNEDKIKSVSQFIDSAQHVLQYDV